MSHKSVAWFLLSCTLLFACQREAQTEYFPVARVLEEIGSQDVTGICEDQHGFIWISSKHGLFRYDGNNYLFFFHDNDDPASISSTYVNQVFCDSKGRIWAATQKGVDHFDYDTGAFTHHPLCEANNYSVTIFENSRHEILTFTHKSIFILDEESGAFEKRASFNNSTINNIHKCNNGDFWVLTLGEAGFNRFDAGATISETIWNDSGIYTSASNGEKILFRDQDGLGLFDMYSKRFEELPPALRDPAFSDTIFLACPDDTTLFIQTLDNCWIWNSQTGELLRGTDRNSPYEIRDGQPFHTFLFMDSHGDLWTDDGAGGARHINREQDGTERFMSTLNGRDNKVIVQKDLLWTIVNGRVLELYSIPDNTVRTCDLPALTGINGSYQIYDSAPEEVMVTCGGSVFAFRRQGDGPSLTKRWDVPSGRLLSSLAINDEGQIWGYGRRGDIYHTSRDGSEMVPFIINHPFGPTSATTSIVMHSGEIIFAIHNGGLILIDPANGQFKPIEILPDNSQLYVPSLYEDKDGILWVATTEHGLFQCDIRKGEVVQVPEFKDDWICSVGEDRHKNIIVCTDTKVFRKDAGGAGFINIWEVPNGIPDYALSFLVLPGRSYCKTSSAYLWFHPLVESHQSLPDILEEIDICHGNDLVSILRDEDGSFYFKPQDKLTTFRILIPEPLSYPARIDNSIQVKIKNGSWNNLYNHEFLLYDLDYGSNLVHLRAQNLYNGAPGKEVSLNIFRKRPPLLSIVAQLLYLLIASVLLFYIVRILQQLKHKREEAKMYQHQYEMEQKVKMEGMDFFANISHEFRTPLTLISSASGALKSNGTKDQNKLLHVIQRNTRRMLMLVNQLLDFNKIEHDALPLSVSETDISSLTEDIVHSFSFSAEQKSINLACFGFEDKLTGWLDSDKYEKVLYNLLSNALKFTSEGSITVEGEVINRARVGDTFALRPDTLDEGGWLMVKVSDSGIGIPEEMVERVFDRFVEAKDSVGGAGIGLYYSKALIKRHHGFIKAFPGGDLDDASQKGSTFVFALPLDRSAYSDTEVADSPAALQGSFVLPPADSEAKETPEPKEDNADSTDGNRPKLLIVDDDIEIVKYLKDLLSGDYQVRACFNATTGYSLIQKENPDIIISDILMPEIDGLKFCAMVKNNIEMSHISVILLTAKAGSEDQIKGLDLGADAYIAKPFNPDYLKAVIRNILSKRKRLREMFASSARMADMEDSADFLPAGDKIFMDRLYDLMERNISSGTLDIQEATKALGLSRTKFFLKVKALTGMSPNEYFKSFRLNKAMEMIKEGKTKLSVIADLTGFSTSGHFASSFKKQFGKLPREINGC